MYNPKVSVLAHSINNETEDELITFVIQNFPKQLQAELRTHRSLSQSHYSSRAIPVKKIIDQVIEEPFIYTWTGHQKGMAGIENGLNIQKQNALTAQALVLRDNAVATCYNMLELGAAKQEINRYLEPWMVGGVILTGTKEAWDWFYTLRLPEGVQPDMRRVASVMLEKQLDSTPNVLELGEWHIPFLDKHFNMQQGLKTKLMVSAARCARVSYSNHDGSFSMDRDLALYEMLVSSNHLTPLEHSARATLDKHANFEGWMSQRYLLENNISVS